MNTKLFVGNLSAETTEEAVKAAFSANGRTVRSVTIPVDRDTKRPRGFAFVELSTAAEAQAAMAELDGRQLGGAAVSVSEARERTFRPKGG